MKAESLFHLTCTAVYIPAIILSVILFPVWDMDRDLFKSPGKVLALALASFFGLLTCSAGSFYMLSQKAVGRSTLGTMMMVPLLMAASGDGRELDQCGGGAGRAVRPARHGICADAQVWDCGGQQRLEEARPEL